MQGLVWRSVGWATAILEILTGMNRHDLRYNPKSLMQNIEDLDRRRHVVDLIADRSKFYIDRWVVSALSLGATVGVMMTILWGDPHGSFIGTRGQKLADSGFMVIAFFYVVCVTGAWVALPAHNIYSKCSRAMLDVMDQDK